MWRRMVGLLCLLLFHFACDPAPSETGRVSKGVGSESASSPAEVVKEKGEAPTLRDILIGCKSAAVATFVGKQGTVEIPLRGYETDDSVELTSVDPEAGRQYLVIRSSADEEIVIPIADDMNGGVDLQELTELELAQ